MGLQLSIIADSAKKAGSRNTELWRPTTTITCKAVTSPRGKPNKTPKLAFIC